jgi:hypothetical protein
MVSVAKTTLIGYGMLVSPEGSGRRDEGREGERPGRQMSHKQEGDRGHMKKATPERALVCATCGRTEHVSATCYYRRHPDANNGQTTWKESVPGKAWAARGFQTLPADRTLREGPAAPGRGENRGETIPLCISCNDLRASIPVDKDILILKININNNVIMCRTLLDTGSIQAKFVNVRTTEALGAAGIQAGTSGRVRVCGAVGGCAFSGSSVVFPLSINNEITGREEVVMLSDMVLDTEYDIIIGKPDVIKYLLIQTLWYAWANITAPTEIIVTGRPQLDTSREPRDIIATIGPADITTEPISEHVSLLDTSQKLATQPSDTRTIEPSWPHEPMQATLLDLPEPQAGPFTEPLTEPFTGRYEERPHEPTAYR